MVQSLWKTVWRFLKELKMELPYDPVIPLLGIHPNQNQKQKREFKKENSLSDIWDNIKHTNIQITGAPEGEGSKERGSNENG